MDEHAVAPISPEAKGVIVGTGQEQITPSTERGSVILLEPRTEGLPEIHAFQDFLYELRSEGISASTSEWLDLQRALREGIITSIDDLYVVSRALLVKDVTGYPQFDRVFGRRFFGIHPPEENPDDYEEDYEESEPIQKEPEDIEEVAEATSLTSEDVHGGNEATKDLQDSPNPADNGQNRENKGAQEGKGEEKGKEEGEGGGGEQENDQGGGNKEETGEGGGDKQEAGEGGGKLKEEGESGEGKKDNDKGGGKRKDKKEKEEVMKEGKGGYSARELILERKYEGFDPNRPLTDAQFSRALAKLTATIREATEIATGRLDADATVRRIAQQAGIPELVWEEELESKPRVIMMFDVGGSTDEFRPIMEKLFGAAREVLDGLKVYYFHNAIYDEVWPEINEEGYMETNLSLDKVLEEDSETKVIIVGDAWMAEEELGKDEEIIWEGKSRRSGLMSFKAIAKRFSHTVWINPIVEKDLDEWDNSGTISTLREVFSMYDLSLRGLDKAVNRLIEE